MKKLPFVIAIPAVIVALLVGTAVVWRIANQSSEVATGGTIPSTPSTSTTKPSSPFGGLFAPKPANPADLAKELESTVDDGGAAEMESLKQEAASL